MRLEYNGSIWLEQKEGSNWVEVFIIDKKKKTMAFFTFNARSANRKKKEIIAAQRDQILRPFKVDKIIFKLPKIKRRKTIHINN